MGKKRMIFDAYGAQHITEENKIDKQTIMGQKKVTKTHTMTYMKGSMVYHVSFDNRRIMRMGNMGAGMAMLMGGGKDMKQTGEEMMKKMGGKKTGTDKVLGYTCDVWEMMGTKQCMYKGIPLRVETDMMGIKNTETATKAEFDLSLSSDDFKMPDFPIYDMQGNKLDRSKLDAMDLKQSAEISQEAADGAKAMTTAMGGEEAMLAKTKQEILGEAEKIPQIIKCFENANSAKAANACEKEYDSEDPDHHAEWNDVIKADLLKDMRTFENAIPCIEKAKTFQAFRMCLPQE